MGPPPDRCGALVSTYQIGPYRRTHRRGALESTRNRFGPIQQTWCISEHKKQLGDLQADTKRSALVSTRKADLSPSKTVSNELVNTNQVGPTGRHKI